MADKANSIEDRFWSKVDVRGPDECWEWRGYRTEKGYGYFKSQFGQRAHRFAAGICREVSGGDGPIVMHLCDNPPCCNPRHLKWGTLSENNKDAFARGRNTQVGVAHSRARLNDAKVRQIKLRLQRGEPVRKIAKDFGMSEGAIYNISSGKNWPHVMLP